MNRRRTRKGAPSTGQPGARPHNVVATSGARFRSPNLLQNQALSFRATREGTIRYVCPIQEGMTGTLVVTS